MVLFPTQNPPSVTAAVVPMVFVSFFCLHSVYISNVSEPVFEMRPNA